MKLLKTIQKLVEESEIEYNQILESNSNPKEIERAERNYEDSLKVLQKFNQLNGYLRK
jgi:lipoate synthase